MRDNTAHIGVQRNERGVKSLKWHIERLEEDNQHLRDQLREVRREVSSSHDLLLMVAEDLTKHVVHGPSLRAIFGIEQELC